MIDLRTTIIPKSDQLNSDDLIGGPLTIKVTAVELLGSEQPVAIRFEGDAGKPYKPCKSMRRVMVKIWGQDGNAYAGRSMTLYRDDKVRFGGLEVGGIRISHMSHIEAPVTMALTETKASRKPFTVKPLAARQEPSPALLSEAEAKAAEGLAAYQAFWKALSKAQQAALLPHHERLKGVATGPGDRPPPDDDFPGDRPSPDAARMET